MDTSKKSKTIIGLLIIVVAAAAWFAGSSMTTANHFSPERFGGTESTWSDYIYIQEVQYHEDPSGEFILMVGSVINTSNIPLALVKIKSSAYDAGAIEIGSNSAFIDSAILAPGAEMTFSFKVFCPVDLIRSVQTVIESAVK